jgi:hypothetical protein
VLSQSIGAPSGNVNGLTPPERALKGSACRCFHSAQKSSNSNRDFLKRNPRPSAWEAPLGGAIPLFQRAVGQVRSAQFGSDLLSSGHGTWLGTRFSLRLSRVGEDVVGTNPTPDHVSLPEPDLIAVCEGGAAIRGEGHLPDALAPPGPA